MSVDGCRLAHGLAFARYLPRSLLLGVIIICLMITTEILETAFPGQLLDVAIEWSTTATARRSLEASVAGQLGVPGTDAKWYRRCTDLKQ
jgi:hypothetical protein